MITFCSAKIIIDFVKKEVKKKIKTRARYRTWLSYYGREVRGRIHTRSWFKQKLGSLQCYTAIMRLKMVYEKVSTEIVLISGHYHKRCSSTAFINRRCTTVSRTTNHKSYNWLKYDQNTDTQPRYWRFLVILLLAGLPQRWFEIITPIWCSSSRSGNKAGTGGS